MKLSDTAGYDTVSDSTVWKCVTAHCDTVSVTTHCDTVSVTALYDSVIGDLTCIALGYGMISDDTFQLLHQCNF